MLPNFRARFFLQIIYPPKIGDSFKKSMSPKYEHDVLTYILDSQMLILLCLQQINISKRICGGLIRKDKYRFWTHFWTFFNGAASHLRYLLLRQRRSSLIADAASRETCLSNWLYSCMEDTIFVVSIMHCRLVSVYWLTTFKELCCRCAMG